MQDARGETIFWVKIENADFLFLFTTAFKMRSELGISIK